ncbi:MAG: hypothetical protein ACR2PW_04785 [Gammaproteobacteria bacterium]
MALAKASTEQQLIEWLRDPVWRLNNLYWIKDETGREVKFRLNWAQQKLFDELHYANLILKARQLGFTTLIQLLQLDACLWNTNIRAGTIAHTVDSAKEIFREKIRFPYERLPAEIKEMVPAQQDSAESLVFGNGSSLRVGTSLRSGTYQWLHISELGYICAHYPEKAEEIRTGALNTVHPGQMIFIESTAKGAIGLFYELADEAQEMHRTHAELGLMDYRFHFFPWWRHPGYSLDEAPPEDPKMLEYFAKLRSYGIDLLNGQKAWYAKKAKTQGGKIKSEFPSTPQEAFEGATGVFFDNFDHDKHVIAPFTVPHWWPRMRALDWGSARPFSVGWYAVSDGYNTAEGIYLPPGCLVKYREWYGAEQDARGKTVANTGLKMTVEQVAKGILERQPKGKDGKSLETFVKSVADPAIFAEDGGPSMGERFHNEGINWSRADNARVPREGHIGGWDQVRQRLDGEDTGPMLVFFDTCRDTIRTVPALQHSDTNPEDIDTESEDHAGDETRYACMARPYSRPKPSPRDATLKGPREATLNELLEQYDREREDAA